MISRRVCLLTDQTNVDKLHLLKNAFCPFGETEMTFDFKKCCTAEGQRFRYLNENHLRIYSWMEHSESCKGLYRKYTVLYFLRH